MLSYYQLGYYITRTYSCNEIRKAQNEHMNIFSQNLSGSPVKSHMHLLSMYLKSMSQKSICTKGNSAKSQGT